MTRLAWSFLALAAVALPGCSDGRPRREGPPRVLLLLPAGAPSRDLPAGVDVVARVEVAADEASRRQGLMDRDSLAPDGGMLFVYGREEEHAFWMKNTRIPLSIAYADSGGTIVRILAMAPGAGTPDDDLPRYPSGHPVRYALEMAQGWFAGKDLHEGDRILLSPELAAIRPR